MHSTSAIARRIPERLKIPAHRLWILVQDAVRSELIKQASAMAYVTLLSLVPSLVAIFCVLSLFTPLLSSNTNLLDKAREFILENLAAESGEAVVNYLEKMLSQINLATIGWSSFASVLVTLILLLRQIEEALNRIWLVRKGRNIFIRFVYFWTFLTLGMLVVAIGVGFSAGSKIQSLLAISAPIPTSSLGWIYGTVAEVVGGFIFFFFLYKVVPNCLVATRNAAFGAVVASVALHLGGHLYGLYVKDAKNYQTLYGALAQVPLFLLWLYICWVIILVGALVSWRLQEGFPNLTEDEALDRVKTPADLLRNNQIKAHLPWIALLAIHKQFASGAGTGLSSQGIAHALRVPVSWVSEALDALQAVGYVVASKRDQSISSGPLQSSDLFFPTKPAEKLMVSEIKQDLDRPMQGWLEHWHHELPIDLKTALALFQKDLEQGQLLTALII